MHAVQPAHAHGREHRTGDKHCFQEQAGTAQAERAIEQRERDPRERKQHGTDNQKQGRFENVNG